VILRGVAGPDDGYTEIAGRLAEWGYVTLLHGWKIRGTDPPDAPIYDDLVGGSIRGIVAVIEQDWIPHAP
jgi:dienelactone hydrolase